MTPLNYHGRSAGEDRIQRRVTVDEEQLNKNVILKIVRQLDKGILNESSVDVPFDLDFRPEQNTSLLGGGSTARLSRDQFRAHEASLAELRTTDIPIMTFWQLRRIDGTPGSLRAFNETFAAHKPPKTDP
ncbi:MAG: hypothetical protein IH864_04870 [Chloroflexi bacterium]|nr:hypothetical protein [Chloroflexota bacterium]